MSSSDDESSRFGPKKKPYTPKFKEEWKKLPEFASWLCKGKTDILFHCNVCFNDYLGGLSAIKRHSKSEKHRDNSKSVSVSKSINQLPKLVQHTSHEYQIKQAEIKLAMFIAEHNIAFQTSNHVVSLFKSMCPDSSVLQGISCNRTKNTSIVNNVIGQYEFEYLLAIMKSQKFSILIDESTDHSAVKHLAIIVRILDYSNYVVRDNFLCLLQIASATAVNIFEKIKTFFTEHNVPYQSNLVGFASDGANTMFGNRHSVKTLLEEDVPGIFVMKCICHSLALCASYACEKIPNNIEEVVRDVYNYMKQSFKRSSEFKEFQVFVDCKPNKLLQPCQTRWLSLNSCIKRVLEQFDALKLYFQGEKLIDNKASTIFANLTDPLTKLYLHFLEFVLPMLVDLNVIFQSTKPKIHELYYKMEVVYKMILECYMKPEYLNSTDISKIQYRNPINFLPSEKIYLGGTCTVALQNNNLISKTAQEQFRTNCLNFYVECSHQIYKRFPFNAANVQLLKLLSFLNPNKIKDIPSIATVSSKFQTLNFDLNAIDREWRQLRNEDLNFNNDVLEFWKTVKNIKINDDETYPLINNLVSHVLLLPHSSACVERLFSAINLNKTKIRNRLCTETLTGILHSKNFLNRQNKSCFDVDIPKDMIKKLNANMYK